jgi:hypothetical protein
MNEQELYNYLHQTFEYRDGEFYYKKQSGPIGKINQMAGCLHRTGYKNIQIKRRQYPAHRLIFLYHNGYLPKTIDHVDRNKSNNKIENLREVTGSENALNTKKYKTNTSGYKGVSWSKNAKKWAAQIVVNKKRIYLGLHDTAELAYEAYCNYCKNNLKIYCL